MSLLRRDLDRRCAKSEAEGKLARWQTSLIGRRGMKSKAAPIVFALLLAPVALSQELTVRHFAGSNRGPGYEDGQGSRARLGAIEGVAVDAAGNTYFADTGYHVIRRVSAAGVVTTLAGLAGRSGSADGRGSTAQFKAPMGVAVDGSGNVWVSDTANSTIRRISPNGTVTTIAGLAGAVGYADGTGSGARFSSPTALAMDVSGDVLVLESAYVGRVRRVTPGGVVTTLVDPLYFSPRGLAADGDGNVYVSINGCVDKFRDGSRTTVSCEFMGPAGLVADPAGNLWVADGGRHTISAVSASGLVTTLAGFPLISGFVDGTGANARFHEPVAIARGADGTLVVADRRNLAIRRVNPATVVTTLCGGPTQAGTDDGTGALARFRSPEGVAFDALGNLYVADTGNSTIRKVTPSGVASTVAGAPLVPGDDDGPAATARFRSPWGIAVDATGNLFVTDRQSHTIRRITPAGDVSTLAGSPGAPGSRDGTGNDARLNGPTGIAVDASGTLWVADTENGRIRRVTPGGVVTTPGKPDAPWFQDALSVAADGTGNVLVADHYGVISKVSPEGVRTDLAAIDSPVGVSVDSAGDAWVLSGYTRTAYKVTSAGIVTPVAGRYQELDGYSLGLAMKDGTGQDVLFAGPRAIAAGPGGRIAILDSHVLRLGEPALPDVATIDAPAGAVGAPRQLGTTPATATAWLWEAVRLEGGSASVPVPDTARDATFTPDRDGLFVVRLTTSDGTRSRISTVSLAAGTVFPTAFVSSWDDICAGGMGQLRAALTGTPPWTVTWSDGFTQTGVTASPATRSVAPATTTSYSVTSVSNAFGQGSTSGFAAVSVNTSPSAVVSGGGSVCAGSTVKVKVSLSGWSPFTLVWSDGVTETNVNHGHERTVTVTGPTTFSLTSFSDARCAATPTGSATFTTKSAPTATVSGSTTVCAGQSTELRADLTGTGPWKVTWSDGFVESGIVAGPSCHVVTPGSTTTYYVTSVSDSICTNAGTGSATITVLAGPAPQVEITTPSPVAPGSTGLVASVPDAGAGATYAWTLTHGTITGGQGSRVITYDVGAAGRVVLDVTVAVPAGCTANGSTWTWVGANPSEPLFFSKLAGPDGGGGWFDGPVATARFHDSSGVATDAAGNAYLLEKATNSVRKVSPDGRVSTLAGLAGASGTANGRGPVARFFSPDGIAATSSGVVYVADTNNQTIRRILPSGDVSTFAGEPAGTTFYYPRGVAVDEGGNLFVADTSAHTIRKVTPAGVISTIAGGPGAPGSADGNGGAARFRSPQGVAVEGSGTVYVADTDNHTIRKITPAGDVTTLAGMPGSQGSRDGEAAQALFRTPHALVVDGAGNVLVADTGNVTIRLISTAGGVSTLAGVAGSVGGADGTGPDARFTSPTGIALAAGGSFVISDRRSLRRMTAGGAVSTVAGEPAAQPGLVDGAGDDARFYLPTALAADASGNVFVADTYNAVIRKVDPSGTASTIAGTPRTCGFVDGTPGVARFCEAWGVAVDAAGTVYVSDTSNNAIRKVSPGGVVTTLAGDGLWGSRDGTGPAARFDGPWGIDIDADGNVWVADSSNHTIRRITPTGLVTTVAGLAGSGGSTDGVGSIARFRNPAGIAVDRHGNVYVAEYDNSTIRKVTPAGVVSTVAGNPGQVGARDGTGTEALFDHPVGIRVNGSGDLYVTDRGSGSIRKVTPDGVVTTIGGGSGVTGGVEGTGRAAQFGSLYGLAIRPNGSLVVSDGSNHRLWQGVPSIADAATIDASTGPIGQLRQLGVSPSTATSWQWELVRTEAASTATLSSTTVPNPTFTPDVPGLYRFRLTASDGVKNSVTIASLHAGLPAPTAHVTGGGTFCPGGYVSFRADFTGTPPVTITWSDGEVWQGYSGPTGWRSLYASTSTTLSITSIVDATGPGTSTGGAVIDVTPSTPVPTISAPSVLGAGSPNRTASVVPHAGNTYSWSISGGTITSVRNEATVTFEAGVPGTLTLHVNEQAPGLCTSFATATIEVLPPGSATQFYTLAPCRVLDTRSVSGPLQGEPLGTDDTLQVDLAGKCGVPEGAKAVAANVTVTQPVAAGHLVLYPTDEAEPVASTVHFGAGRTRASSTQIKLPTTGYGKYVVIKNASPGSVHVILDVSGYYE
jgi:sugar lactone lactonase YvrE